jgi:hypothetical protein
MGHPCAQRLHGLTDARGDLAPGWACCQGSSESWSAGCIVQLPVSSS